MASYFNTDNITRTLTWLTSGMQVVSSIDELQKFLAASNAALDKRLPGEQSDKAPGLSAIQSVCFPCSQSVILQFLNTCSVEWRHNYFPPCSFPHQYLPFPCSIHPAPFFLLWGVCLPYPLCNLDRQGSSNCHTDAKRCFSTSLSVITNLPALRT